MKRSDGYYWVQIHPLYAGTSDAIWVVCLYRGNPGIWLAPGLQQPLADDHFKTISEKPIDHPLPQSTTIWTPA